MLTIPDSSTLEYKERIFVLKNNSKIITFTIFPIFFCIKFLLSKGQPDFYNRVLLEYLLDHTSRNTTVLLSIADEEHVKKFFEFCTMKYLSNYVHRSLESDKSIFLPKIFNISQFPN